MVLQVATNLTRLLEVGLSELNPNFNSVNSFVSLLALVEQSYASKQVSVREDSCDDPENETLPEGLHNVQVIALEVDLIVTTLRVHLVLPGWLDLVDEQAERVYSLFVVINRVPIFSQVKLSLTLELCWSSCCRRSLTRLCEGSSSTPWRNQSGHGTSKQPAFGPRS